MIDLDDAIAIRLLKKGRILVGFLSCQIRPYSPIIRCSNCQYYGHTSEKCRRNSTCAYCSKNHESKNCPVQKETRKHKCINCTNTIFPDGRAYEYNHAANSSRCQVYQNIMQQRNLLINQVQSNSRR